MNVVLSLSLAVSGNYPLTFSVLASSWLDFIITVICSRILEVPDANQDDVALLDPDFVQPERSSSLANPIAVVAVRLSSTTILSSFPFIRPHGCHRMKVCSRTQGTMRATESLNYSFVASRYTDSDLRNSASKTLSYTPVNLEKMHPKHAVYPCSPPVTSQGAGDRALAIHVYRYLYGRSSVQAVLIDMSHGNDKHVSLCVPVDTT